MKPFARPSSAAFAGADHHRILVVGYSQSCRHIFATVLSMSGYEVSTAVDAVEALRRIALETFDLVLTDWKMPILTGGSLVLAMRSKGIPTPIIMLSGDFANSPLPAAVATEIFAALEMPINPPMLISTVSAALRDRQDGAQSYAHAHPLLVT